MPVITLTSDIGLQDYMVGAMKGILLQTCPSHQVIDISHDIIPFNLPQAAYLFKSALPCFPTNSCHFILVDLFVKKPQPLLLCHQDGHYFFCANNGLLPMIFGERPTEVYQITSDSQMHTLDIFHRFAETAHNLSSGMLPEELGPPVTEMEVQNPLAPFIQEDYIEGQVIFIDRFENVIVNITKEQFEQSWKGRGFKIFVMRDDYISQIHNSYAEVSEGGKVALFNAAGYLEIAINKGNAAGLFGLQHYSRKARSAGMNFHKSLFYQTIRIYFE